MKKLMTVIAVLTMSSTVFAGTKDLEIMNTLLNVGVESEQFMSRIHISLENVECSFSNVSNEYNCNMNDLSVNGGEGAQRVLTGNNARAIFNILSTAGAPGDSGMGKTFLSSKGIRCGQAVAGVMDGTEAERTVCTIDTSAQ